VPSAVIIGSDELGDFGVRDVSHSVENMSRVFNFLIGIFFVFFFSIFELFCVIMAHFVIV
jgi:uncharacterized Tic20 family protein